MRTMDEAFQAAAAIGVTVCVAGGDNGSADGVKDGLNHVDFPASSPYVLACGGTCLIATGGTISDETVWNELVNDEGATGGGISDVFSPPEYRSTAHVPHSANPGHNVGRGVPDVSGNADPTTGYVTRVDGRGDVIGGTSAVAPLWAGFITHVEVETALHRRICHRSPIHFQLSKALLHTPRASMPNFKRPSRHSLGLETVMETRYERLPFRPERRIHGRTLTMTGSLLCCASYLPRIARKESIRISAI
jgi:subtilase family serine protease